MNAKFILQKCHVRSQIYCLFHLLNSDVCPNISNYTDRQYHLTQHFFGKILQLLSYSGLGEKFETGRSLSLKSVWKKRLDFSCHTTAELSCLFFEADSNCQNFWDVYFNCNTLPLLPWPAGPPFSHPLNRNVCCWSGLLSKRASR